MIDADNEAVAFYAGREACASGAFRSSNPHARDTAIGAAWTRGWVSEYRALPAVLQQARRLREPELADLETPNQ